MPWGLPWTEREDRIIRDTAERTRVQGSGRGKRLRALTAVLDRTEDAIRQRAWVLRARSFPLDNPPPTTIRKRRHRAGVLLAPPARAFTEQEDQAIRACPRGGLQALAPSLNRSARAVQRRARKLHVTSQNGTFGAGHRRGREHSKVGSGLGVTREGHQSRTVGRREGRPHFRFP